MEKLGKAYKINKIIQETIVHLQQYLHVDKVILYGSQLTGKTHKYSDIDLVILSSEMDNVNILKRIDFLAKVGVSLNPIVELRIFGTKEFKNAEKASFLGYIKDIGKVVYDRK